jgi:hypothetical protein
VIGRSHAAAAGELLPPKRIAVSGRPIRLRWLQQIIWSFLAANIGALIMVALSYLLVQLRWHVGGHTLLYLKPRLGQPVQIPRLRRPYRVELASLEVR